MRRHVEKRVLPYTPEQLFELVADVERYPEFLPWCQQATVTRKGDHELKAVLRVGFKSLHDTFTSLVRLDPFEKIEVSYGGGPLTHLKNEWTFHHRAEGGCEVTFLVEFAFKSMLLGHLMDMFFEAAFCRMVSAFEERAATLYDKQDLR